jgi:hypothetical protein
MRTVKIKKRNKDTPPSNYSKISVEERTRANMAISYDEQTIAEAREKYAEYKILFLNSCFVLCDKDKKELLFFSTEEAERAIKDAEVNPNNYCGKLQTEWNDCLVKPVQDLLGEGELMHVQKRIIK